MKWKNAGYFLFWTAAIIWSVEVILMIFLSGCASFPTHENLPDVIHTPTQQIIYESIKSTDWLLSLLMVGCVLGIFSGLNGMKTGWAGVAACVGGIVLKAALSSTYVYWLCGALFIGCVLAAIASILWKNKAIAEIIIGTNKLKNDVGNSVTIVDANKVLSDEQSKDTRALVNQVKAKLKTKGIL
jgi:hypothetical protein